MGKKGKGWVGVSRFRKRHTRMVPYGKREGKEDIPDFASNGITESANREI